MHYCFGMRGCGKDKRDEDRSHAAKCWHGQAHS